MNERIEELKKQAEAAADEIFDRKGKMYGEIVMEKFAELIVKECMNIVGDGTVDGEIYHDRIKHHFGVEE